MGTISPRAFTGDDVNLLQLAADRAAVAVQALTARVQDRAVTEALQRSLVPSALPAVGGLELAAGVPGTGKVGGDWYGVFPLPGGEVCAVIGDVAGPGLPAAVIMGRIRSVLRARPPSPDGPRSPSCCWSTRGLGQRVRATGGAVAVG